MADEASSDDHDATSGGSDNRSDTDFDTAMQRRRPYRCEGRWHRPAQVHIHHRRAENLHGSHGEDHHAAVETRSRRMRRSAALGVVGMPAPSGSVGVAGRGDVPTAAKLATPRRRRTGNWADAVLSNALDAITDNGMKVNAASRKFGIPASFLRDHLLGKTRSRQRGNFQVLKLDEEKKLVDYIFKMQDLGHPLTTGELRLKVALATQSRETTWSATGVPGKGWLRRFRLRHPEIATRKAQGLEVNRASALCSAETLYNNLKELYLTFHYPPSHIWNCDESGVQAGRSGGAIVLAKWGSRLVHSIEPDQREHLSVLSCINVDGGSIPNFYILKGTYFLEDYIARCEDGAVIRVVYCVVTDPAPSQRHDKIGMMMARHCDRPYRYRDGRGK